MLRGEVESRCGQRQMSGKSKLSSTRLGAKIHEEMPKEVNELQQQVCEFENTNQQLVDFIATIEERDSLQSCSGRKVTDLGKKQQSRKLKLLRNKAQCALWFLQSFGLELSNLKLKDEKGNVHTIDYEPHNAHNGDGDVCKKDRENIEKVLLLMDKFCVGDEVYHEFSITCDDLPRGEVRVKQNIPH